MRRAAGSGVIALFILLCATCVLALQAHAQTPPPPLPARPNLVPLDPARQQAFETQREAFNAYQKCVAEHRRAVDLHNAAREIVEFRNNRATLERQLQAYPQARDRFPGGVDQAVAQVFAQYKSLGGPATSVAEVSELPNPCPAPRLDSFRSPPTGAPSSISQRRELALQPAATPPPPADPPRTFTPAASPPLRRALEQAWLAHVIAVRSGKEIEIEKTMSSYYFGTTRNNVARSGRALTSENIVALGRFFPDLNGTRFVTVIENGPTAALVHAHDATQVDSTNKPQVEYHFFRFVDEGHGWKIDAYGIIHASKYQADGSPAPFSLPANAHPAFRIDGQIRPAPVPIPVAR